MSLGWDFVYLILLIYVNFSNSFIKSGNIIEFTDEEIEKIQKRIAEKHGYKLVDSKLELYCVKK